MASPIVELCFVKWSDVNEVTAELDDVKTELGNDVVKKLADEKKVFDIDEITFEEKDFEKYDKVIDVAVSGSNPKENKLIAWSPEQQLPLRRGE